MGVGFRVAAFVAVVVGEAVRQHEQQPVRRAGLCLENLARAADARAQPGVAGRLELVEPGASDGAESLTEGLDRRQVDSVPPWDRNA